MPDIRDLESSILSSDVKPQVLLEPQQVQDAPTIPAKIVNSSAPIRMQRSGADTNTRSAYQPDSTSYVPSVTVYSSKDVEESEASMSSDNEIDESEISEPQSYCCPLCENS